MNEIFRSYLKKLTERSQRGDAREESFYRPLADLLEKWQNKKGSQSISVTTNPSKTEGGNPDFRVWDGHQSITGYIEAKFPGKDLRQVENTEQLQRYRETFPNLILTDFLKFRLYRDGELVENVQIAQQGKLDKPAQKIRCEEESEVEDLLEKFFSFSSPKSFSSKELALNLARRTRFLRDAVYEQLKAEIEAEEGDLMGFYEAFQTYLIAHLEPHAFADLYAQTLTYGLFVARTRTDEEFTRQTAARYIPDSIGILHEMFEYISYGDVPKTLVWMLDDIAEVLAVAEIDEILPSQSQAGGASDTVFHFYETFLGEYDPEERKQRGVFYTPDPVVSYIVRSLSEILKDRYKNQDGLASKNVTLLDPAAGTMTFVAKAYQEAINEFTDEYGQGGIKSFIREHLLENFYAFELMVAPYALGHLKMASLLQEFGYTLDNEKRVPFYLTNTLEVEELNQTQLPGLKSLAKESQVAGEVKKESPIMVILGNPPYSGVSSNKGDWIEGLIEDYKYIDGEHFGEKKHWLQDDYVKFIRFAQWKIEQTGHGVVGMITNHSWLENPTFRGMRWQLLKTFDEIRVLDLHGDSLKKETTPEGKKDENVFDIRMGVGIWFFIKYRDSQNRKAKVYHAERWGVRESKYTWLEEHDLSNTDWEEITPKSDFYLFSPRDEATKERFKEFPSVKDIFPMNVTGIITARDNFVIDFDKDALEKRIETFRDPKLSDEEVRERFNLNDTRGWEMTEARKKIMEDENWREKIIPISYRPFDSRWIFYHQHAIDWGREEVMRHMLAGKNLAFITSRSNKSSSQDQFFCSPTVAEAKCGESTTQSYTFPLYRYPGSKKHQLNFHSDDNKRKPNLSRSLLTSLDEAYGFDPSPREIFYYIYAASYAPSYRDKYADYLSIDFPKIPFTADSALFKKYTELGQELVDLHLLKSNDLNSPSIRFEGEGNNKVVRRKSQGFHYDKKTERKYINETQYFLPISRDLWSYQIGGYQVLRKWLKDRKGRKLNLEEIRTYCQIATALKRTMDLQKEIDALYPEVEQEYLSLDI